MSGPMILWVRCWLHRQPSETCRWCRISVELNNRQAIKLAEKRGPSDG